MPPTIWFAFLAAPSAISVTNRINAMLVLMTLDWAFGVSDALLEEKSRKALGGLSRAEYLVHLMATGMHSGAEVLVLTAWFLSPAHPRGVVSGWSSSLVLVLALASVAVALMHVALLHPRFKLPAKRVLPA